MKRIFLISIFLFSLFPLSNAQTDQFPNLISPTKVTTIGYWFNGQKMTYEVKETAASYKGKSEKPFRESSTGYSIELEVTDSTATSYDFELRYTNPVSDPDADEFTRKINELSTDIPVRYRTNELGQFDTILNIDELRTELLAKLEESKKIVADVKTEELSAVYALVIGQMAAQFNDPQKVEALFQTDILMLHGYYGFELQSGQPLDIELYYPAIIGDYVMAGTGKLTLGPISKPKDECSITATEKPNRDEVKACMESMAMVFMMDSGKKLSLEELNLSMNTKRKMIMELSTGKMKSIVNTTTVKLTNKKGEQRKVATRTYVCR